MSTNGLMNWRKSAEQCMFCLTTGLGTNIRARVKFGIDVNKKEHTALN